MQTNDYAKWGGYVIKVISGEPYNYTVYILERGNIRENVSCYHISLLIKGELEACGLLRGRWKLYPYPFYQWGKGYLII